MFPFASKRAPSRLPFNSFATMSMPSSTVSSLWGRQEPALVCGPRGAYLRAWRCRVATRISDSAVSDGVRSARPSNRVTHLKHPKRLKNMRNFIGTPHAHHANTCCIASEETSTTCNFQIERQMQVIVPFVAVSRLYRVPRKCLLPGADILPCYPPQRPLPLLVRCRLPPCMRHVPESPLL